MFEQHRTAPCHYQAAALQCTKPIPKGFFFNCLQCFSGDRGGTVVKVTVPQIGRSMVRSQLVSLT